MSSPRVTVVSVFHNRDAFVADSVASLAAQTEPGARVVLVDDCSTDGTLEALRAAALPHHEVVAHPTNIGLVTTLRHEVARATTPYVAIHGSGDLSSPTRLRRQADLLDADEQVVAVGCLYRAENLIDGRRSGPQHLPAWGDRRRIADARAELLEGNLFTHGEVMFRTAAYHAAGGYRTAFHFSQDRDLWMRMSLHGAFALVDEDLYLRRSLPGGVSGSQLKRAQQRVLSDLSAACFRERLERGTDLVDELGPPALLAFRSPETAAKLRRIALGGALAEYHDTQRVALELAASLGSPWRARAQRIATWPLRRVPGTAAVVRAVGDRVAPGERRPWRSWEP